MNVGILSMHRVFNHGSFWQAYLLRKMIEDSGHKVNFIDIIPGRRIVDYPKRKFAIRKLKRLPYKIIFEPREKNIFRKIQATALGCSSIRNYSCAYDCIIIGSDEVFNFAQAVPWGFSLQLHGAINNNNISSYAASFGTSTYEDVLKYGVQDELIMAMSNLKHISVRDENSHSIVEKLLPNVEVLRHLDPVLVGDLPLMERKKEKQKFIAIYSYNLRFNEKNYIAKIKEFASKNGYKVYSVGSYQTWVDKNINVDPYELLQYFADAEYVITDTFHGTIFSVKYHKKFVSVIRESNRFKMSSLLSDLGLQSRLLTEADELERVLCSEIDYAAVDEKIRAEKQRTEEYLRMCLTV